MYCMCFSAHTIETSFLLWCSNFRFFLEGGGGYECFLWLSFAQLKLRLLYLLRLFNCFSVPLLCEQGCQMVSFQTKNPNLGKFWMALDAEMLTYFTDIWDILRPFGTFCVHLVHFFRFWYRVPRKSGNPVCEAFYICFCPPTFFFLSVMAHCANEK
jgi:hypothetical protein